eukprot:scaffold254338_cov31-Prasinocladus_malaysianus.AAC.1
MDAMAASLIERLMECLIDWSIVTLGWMLVCQGTIQEANDTIVELYTFDERQPQSPSRGNGIEPNCNLCDGKGNFEVSFA